LPSQVQNLASGSMSGDLVGKVYGSLFGPRRCPQSANLTNLLAREKSNLWQALPPSRNADITLSLWLQNYMQVVILRKDWQKR
jgi:hypothetical protein